MTSNNDKILKALKTTKESMTTTELANKTGIDIRNITRYLKPLENKGIITRDTIQNGKIRVVKVELSKEKPHPPVTPRLMPKLHPPKEVQLIEEEKALVNIGKGNDSLKQVPKRKTIQEQIFFIDWDYLAHNSSFQRGFTEFIKYTFPQYKGIDHRASKKVMNQQLKERTNEIDIALNIVSKIDSKLLRELRKNPLYVEQKLKHNK